MRVAIFFMFSLCWLGTPLTWGEPEEIDEEGCRNCHRFSSNEKETKEGINLFYAGDKFVKSWLVEFLQSPILIRKVLYPEGLDNLNGKSKSDQHHVVLTKEQSQRVSNFLMTLRLSGLEVGKINEEPLSKAEQTQAKILFERNYGCISCHQVLNLVGKVRGGISGPSLVDSGLRLNSGWIFNWLKTPKKFVSKGRMPIFALDEETTIQLTKYILNIRAKP